MSVRAYPVFCPNCGIGQTVESNIVSNDPLLLMCSWTCRNEWVVKRGALLAQQKAMKELRHAVPAGSERTRVDA